MVTYCCQISSSTDNHDEVTISQNIPDISVAILTQLVNLRGTYCVKLYNLMTSLTFMTMAMVCS